MKWIYMIGGEYEVVRIEKTKTESQIKSYVLDIMFDDLVNHQWMKCYV